MTLSLPWLTSLLFISIRLGTVLLFTPIQAIRQLPVTIRFILMFLLSLLLVNSMVQETASDTPHLVLGGIAEFTNGLILSTSLYAAFAVLQIAGQLIDNETGLNSLAIFNPEEHHQEPISSHLLSLLAVLYFFSMDGHLLLFKGLMYSFILIPPGSLTLFTHLTPVMKQFSFTFAMAFMIACPIVLALLAVEMCGAIMTRNMPQISTYFLTLPIKIMLGLFLLALMLNYLNPLLNTIFERCFHTWQEIMS